MFGVLTKVFGVGRSGVVLMTAIVCRMRYVQHETYKCNPLAVAVYNVTWRAAFAGLWYCLGCKL